MTTPRTGRDAADYTPDEIRAKLEAALATPARVPDDATEACRARHDVVTLADVAPESVRWLWRDWLAHGKLHVLDGDPGQGKSTTTADLAARITTGAPMPGETMRRAPAAVLFVTYEDGLGDTLRPRLEAAGADLGRVQAWRGTRTADATVPPVFPDDLGALRVIVDDLRPALIVVDPLMAALAGEVNSFRDQDVRRVLAHLARVAEDADAAVLLVRHLRKGTAGNAIHAGGGSIGIVGAARVGWSLAPHPDDPEARVLAQVKNNVAPLAPSRVLRLDPTPSGVARVRWDGTTDLTAEALHAAREDRPDDGGPDVDDWLRAVLAAGPVPSRDLKRLAGDEGHAWRSVQRRLRAIGAVATRTGTGAAHTSSWGFPAVTRATSEALAPLAPVSTRGASGASGASDPPEALAFDLPENAA